MRPHYLPPTERQVFPDTEQLWQGAATYIADLAATAVAMRGRFHWALAGGKTPQGLYRYLAPPKANGQPWLPWPQTWIFFGDERAVPPTDPDSNYRVANETLLSPVAIDPAKVYRMAGELGAAAAAERYEAQLRSYFPGEQPNFDLVLLGLGSDGHTASLFPQDDIVLSETRRWVMPTPAHLGQERITLTRPGLTGAQRLMFLVSGTEKAVALARLFDRDLALPASRVAGEARAVCYFCDAAAISRSGTVDSS